MAVVPSALQRASSESLRCTGNLTLRIYYAPPLCSSSPPAFVLYVMDADPEMFTLACAHVFGRYGYDLDESAEASLMRTCAIVGVGHDPTTYGAHSYGWDTDVLREHRRRDYLRGADDDAFLRALQTDVIPIAECRLGLAAALPSRRRAILGCSLSSLLALRSLLRESAPRERPFGLLILGSPSLWAAPELIEEARRLPKPRSTKAFVPADVLVVWGEGEAGNGIPERADCLARVLSRVGHRVTALCISGEDHNSLISYTFLSIP